MPMNSLGEVLDELRHNLAVKVVELQNCSKDRQAMRKKLRQLERQVEFTELKNLELRLEMDELRKRVEAAGMTP